MTGLLRKAALGIRLSEHLDGDGETIFRHAFALGLPAFGANGVLLQQDEQEPGVEIDLHGYHPSEIVDSGALTKLIQQAWEMASVISR